MDGWLPHDREGNRPPERDGEKPGNLCLTQAGNEQCGWKIWLGNWRMSLPGSGLRGRDRTIAICWPRSSLEGPDLRGFLGKSLSLRAGRTIRKIFTFLPNFRLTCSNFKELGLSFTLICYLFGI